MRDSAPAVSRLLEARRHARRHAGRRRALARRRESGSEVGRRGKAGRRSTGRRELAGRRSGEAGRSIASRATVTSLGRRGTGGKTGGRRRQRGGLDRSAALLVRGRDALVVGRRRETSGSGRRGRAGAVEHGSGGAGSRKGRLLEELRGQRLGGRLDTVLASFRREGTLGSVTMALTLAVLLVGVLDADLLVHEVLAVHVRNGIIRGLKRREGDEAVALG